MHSLYNTQNANSLEIKAKAQIKCRACESSDSILMQLAVEDIAAFERIAKSSLDILACAKGWRFIDIEPKLISGICPLCSFAYSKFQPQPQPQTT